MSTGSSQRLQDTDLPLAGKVALVTGGSRGIGRAIASRLTRLGVDVAVCARNRDEIERAAAPLRQGGRKILPIVADVTRADDVHRMIEQTCRELGEIEILVNNAGAGRFGPFYELCDSDWDAVVNTNLKAVFLTSRVAAPRMIRLGRGHIINISSLASKSAFAGGAIYCASKWGLMGLSSCMAEDLRAHGIRVSVVCPGSVATGFSSHAGRSTTNLLQPEDVAYAVETLLTQSEQSFISEIDVRPLRKS
ncbi:MAG TPA: SDR family NAD(P)-dependent oxidoreductase [Candidatus Acidoferrales bacterium]|jgi:NAD(P)-dependent dehydrogenase (short-subunit alcohol dehydrogenase family)|nr:SDR family NAD(P)-dependent oxidoreductase [Candidatus Acidoferrales bacterium]